MAHRPTGLRGCAPAAIPAQDNEISLLGEVRALRQMLDLLTEQARQTDDAATLLRLAGAIARLSDTIVRALNAHHRLAGQGTAPASPSATAAPAPAPRPAAQPVPQRPRPALPHTPRPSALAALLGEVDGLVPPTPPPASDEPPAAPAASPPKPAPPGRRAQPRRSSRTQRSRRGRH